MSNKYSDFKTEEVTLDSSGYPKRLLLIKSPPKKIYYRGNLDLAREELILGVVGTRTPTEYGKRALQKIVVPLAQQEVVIVSGLAFGVDFLSHEAALKFSGKTIAVMAGGIDSIYPPEHQKMALEILKKGGLILGEHPDGTSYLRQHFPARNRIIAGLANSVLVVEAKTKSGSLITAEFALKEKKKVFAVPGSIFSSESEGTNHLFSRGALPAVKSEDIFCFHSALKSNEDQKITEKEIKKNLNEEEKNIFQHIFFEESISLNDLIKKSGLSSSATIAIITQLELKGVIKEVGGARYVKRM